MPLSPEDRELIFDTIRDSLKKVAPPMAISKDNPGVFELMGNKQVPYGSKKVIVPGMYFSSVVARKDSVSFYFFPMYYMVKDYETIFPTMHKYLKGKTCFTFKKPEQVVTKELDAMLKKGVQAWKKAGYMKL
jgi:hypothetical protein